MSFLKQDDVNRLILHPLRQKVPVIRWKAIAIPGETSQSSSLNRLGREYIFGMHCCIGYLHGNSQLRRGVYSSSVPCMSMYRGSIASTEKTSLAYSPMFASLD